MRLQHLVVGYLVHLLSLPSELCHNSKGMTSMFDGDTHEFTLSDRAQLSAIQAIESSLGNNPLQYVIDYIRSLRDSSLEKQQDLTLKCVSTTLPEEVDKLTLDTVSLWQSAAIEFDQSLSAWADQLICRINNDIQASEIATQFKEIGATIEAERHTIAIHRMPLQRLTFRVCNVDGTVCALMLEELPRYEVLQYSRAGRHRSTAERGMRLLALKFICMSADMLMTTDHS